MALPQREERLVTNGINRDCPPAQWRSAVVASFAAACGRSAGTQCHGRGEAAAATNTGVEAFGLDICISRRIACQICTEMERKSIADKLGWPDGLRTALFVVALAIWLSPILGGLELGAVKVPKLPESLRSIAIIVGPVATVLLLLLLIPIFPLRKRSFSAVLDEGSGGWKINSKLDESPGGGAVMCVLQSRWWITPASEKPVTIVAVYVRERDDDELGEAEFSFLDDKGDPVAPKEFTGSTHLEVRGVIFVQSGVKNREVEAQLVFKDVRGSQVKTPWLRFSYNRVAVIA